MKTIFSQIQNSPSLITWRLIETKMCWGVIFLLGGGFALANASQVNLIRFQVIGSGFTVIF